MKTPTPKLQLDEWNNEENEETINRNSQTIENLIESLMERDSTSRDSNQKSGEARGSGVGEETQLSAQFYSIILPIFFFFFTLFSILPLTYQVIIDQTCIELDADDCSDSEVSSKASLTVLYANTATYLPGLLTTGFYSSVANIYGRKVVMIISLFGVVIYSSLFAYVVFVEPKAYMAIIIMASFFMGVTGTYTTFMMGAFSFVADTTHPSRRTRAYSIAESCLYIGKIVGPLASGFWAQSFGFRVPFLTAAVAAALCIVYVSFFVKESLFLMKERQSSLAVPRQPDMPEDSSVPPNNFSSNNQGEKGNREKLVINPMQTYHNLKFLFYHKVSVGQSPIPFIAMAFFFFHFSLMGFLQVVYVYMKYEYNWNSLLIGMYDSINGIIQAGSMLFAPAIVHRLLRRELDLSTWIMMGYSLRSLHWFALGALATSTATVFAILPINLLTGLVIPYTRALLSNSVLPEAQAQMFAGLSGIESIGTLMSPLFSLGYSLTVSTYGEAMFLIMSALTGCSALIMFHIRSRKLIQFEQYGPTCDDDCDIKEPILGSESSPDTYPMSPKRSFSRTHSRAHSIASNATYGDRQISLSIAF